MSDYVEQDCGFTSPCWIWQRSRDVAGYGRLWRLGHSLAHRWSYEQHVGPIPEGLELDHLCRVPACVNPGHLEPVSHAENMARSAPAVKTHCVNGHAYDEANTYARPSGQRDCRACIRERAAKYRLSIRERTAA